MSDQSSFQILAVADGGAEVQVLLRLRWEAVAALGHEASRLAAQLHRPVGLDEAASHKLSAGLTFGSGSSKDRAEPSAPPSRMALASGSPSPAESAKERTLGAAAGTAPATAAAARPSGGTTAEVLRPFDPAGQLASLAGTAQDPSRASG